MGQPKSGGQQLSSKLDPEQILEILKTHNEDASRELAGRADAAPEALFYLAKEGSAETRRAVAANPSSPAHANRLLADDTNDEVRVELARKIGQLLPNLPADAGRRMRELTIETIERLARDTLPRVRQALAEEIKSLDCVPKRVVKALARDVEKVAAPILEYSPLLSDADLMEIIATAQASFALLAIAKRRPLSASVSEAVAAALDVPAVAALLLNSSAHIRRQTLDKIARHAEKVTDWHLPLVLHHDLPQRTIRRIATFVSAALVEKLASRQNLDEKTRRHLKNQMQKRIDEGEVQAGDRAQRGKAQDLVALRKAGKLDDAYVEGAAESGAREMVIAALALLADTTPERAAKIFQTASPKAITALVWRAGLSMRVAFKIQTLLLKLPAENLLPAREGFRFPMTEDEMRWHLSYFEVA